MTRKEMVLEALKSGEKTNYELQSVGVGGCAGLRRARELRKDGYKIEIRRVWKDGRATGTFVYKLVEEPKPEIIINKTPFDLFSVIDGG